MGVRLPAHVGSKQEFLAAFRRIVVSQCNQSLEAATCHDVLHTKVRSSTKEREKKYQLAVRMNQYFPYKAIASAFREKHGVQISFTFKTRTFEHLLGYLMMPGQKPVEELDTEPAKYPSRLHLQPELPADPVERPTSHEEPEPVERGRVHR